MKSGNPHYGRDPSRGKGIANYQSSSFHKEENICSNMNHDVTIDTPLILSYAHSSNTARSPPISTPSPSQNSMPQTKYTQKTTPLIFMRTLGSHVETSRHNGPAHSADLPSSPLHIHDDVDDDTQSWDNDEIDREIVGEKSPQRLRGNDTDDHQGKIMIFPDGIDFAPKQVALSAITAVIKNRYRNGLKSYRTIKKNETIHKKWFDVFKRKVEWLPQDEHLVMKIFDRKCSHRLSDMLRDARISAHRPDWIDEMAWASLQEYWSSDDFKRISQKNKRTRAFGKGGSLHIGGTISTPEHAQQMGGKDHDGIQMTKPNQEKYIGSLKTKLHDASGNAEEGSIYITLNDSNPNQQNYDPLFPLVPPGFEPITRDTQKPQGNQQKHDSNPDQQNYDPLFPLVPPGFEPITRDTQKPQGNQQKHDSNPNQQNYDPLFPLVPPGFEPITRDTQIPQGNLQKHDSNIVKVGKTISAMVDGEFHSGFWITVKDGDSSNPPFRGMIFKPGPSKENNESSILATMMGIGASGSLSTGSANHVASSRMNNVSYVATTAGPLETTKVVPVEFKASALLSEGMNQASFKKGKKYDFA